MKSINDCRLGTVAAIASMGVSAERLRYWERLGIVKPKYLQCGTRKFRRYSEEDVQKAVLIKSLVDDEKYTLEGAIRKMNKK
jgi:DNA-binding transcriptional MerR regulator